MLLRSVHSILDNTPSHLVDTIILVDDKSTMGQTWTRHSTTQYSTTQYNTTQCNTIQYNVTSIIQHAESHLVDTVILFDDKSTVGQSWTRHSTTPVSYTHLTLPTTGDV